MQAPKKKTSQSRRNTRRAHDAIPMKRATTCKNCSAPVLSHCACRVCGFYRGRFVLDTGYNDAATTDSAA